MTDARSTLTDELAKGNCVDWQAMLDSIPYAKYLKLQAEGQPDSATRVLMPYEDRLVGNMLLPAIHGGAIGALMEVTAMVACSIAVRSERLPKLIDSTTDYLRSSKTENTWATANLVRQGRRVIAVRTTAWQSRPDHPVATGRMHFLTQSV